MKSISSYLLLVLILVINTKGFFTTKNTSKVVDCRMKMDKLYTKNPKDFYGKYIQRIVTTVMILKKKF
jgi:hypothetical protein